MERLATDEYTAEDSSIIRMAAAEAQDKFEDAVNRVASGEERVILSQNGKDVAAIISIEEFWFLERVIGQLEDEIDVENARVALDEIEKEGTVSWEALKAELGL